nr:glutamate--cysteine ligase [Parashewanella tropica]
MKTFGQNLAALDNPSGKRALSGIRRGIEREALRVKSDGQLSSKPHSKALGSALTHSRITTDYSESLLEFITPVFDDIPSLFNDLKKTHVYAINNIDSEVLWPVSMPCFVKEPNKIPVAQYGTSNVGQLKTLYRVGLTHRYGAQMQIISGVHFNFSVSQELWELLYKQSNSDLTLEEFISESYFGLIRNYRRQMWILPYLFGASPALCGSFLKGLDTDLPFKKSGLGTLYLPYATSLRMSDLGYTNKEQDTLGISYNSLAEYLEGMKRAIRLPSAKFADIGVKVGDDYRQLNANILQIENEFYAPIRPKRVAQAGEKPSDALARGGVEYIEVRALDVNPYSPFGISEDQVRFLDLFLLYCLLTPSKHISDEDEKEMSDNLEKIILQGRQPNLQLSHHGETIEVTQWLSDIFEQLKPIADLMDDEKTASYHEALALWQKGIDDPDSTLSGKVLNEFVSNNEDHGPWVMSLAHQYQQELSQTQLSDDEVADYRQQAEVSLKQQQQLEIESVQLFDDYLQDYFHYLRD